MKTQISVDEQVIMTIFTKYMQAKLVLEKQNLIQDGILKESNSNYGKQKIEQTNIKNYQNHVQIVNCR